MSRDLSNDTIDYGFCNYLIDDECTNEMCSEYSSFPRREQCKASAKERCKHFKREDGNGFGYWEDEESDD